MLLMSFSVIGMIQKSFMCSNCFRSLSMACSKLVFRSRTTSSNSKQTLFRCCIQVMFLLTIIGSLFCSQIFAHGPRPDLANQGDCLKWQTCHWGRGSKYYQVVEYQGRTGACYILYRALYPPRYPRSPLHFVPPSWSLATRFLWSLCNSNKSYF